MRLAVVMSPPYIAYHAVIIIYLFVYGAKRLDPEFHVVGTSSSLVWSNSETSWPIQVLFSPHYNSKKSDLTKVMAVDE